MDVFAGLGWHVKGSKDAIRQLIDIAHLINSDGELLRHWIGANLDAFLILGVVVGDIVASEVNTLISLIKQAGESYTSCGINLEPLLSGEKTTIVADGLVEFDRELAHGEHVLPVVRRADALLDSVVVELSKSIERATKV